MNISQERRSKLQEAITKLILNFEYWASKNIHASFISEFTFVSPKFERYNRLASQSLSITHEAGSR